MSATDFKAVSYPLRVYSGKDALQNLPTELKRHAASRASIACGKTVSRHADLIARMRRVLGSARSTRRGCWHGASGPLVE